MRGHIVVVGLVMGVAAGVMLQREYVELEDPRWADFTGDGVNDAYFHEEHLFLDHEYQNTFAFVDGRHIVSDGAGRLRTRPGYRRMITEPEMESALTVPKGFRLVSYPTDVDGDGHLDLSLDEQPRSPVFSPSSLLSATRPFGYYFKGDGKGGFTLTYRRQ